MAEYLIQGETLDAIAEAINQKAGTQNSMTPAEMVTAIGAISGGGGWELLAEATATEDVEAFRVDIPAAKQNMAAYIVEYDCTLLAGTGSSALFPCPRINSISSGSPYTAQSSTAKYSVGIARTYSGGYNMIVTGGATWPIGGSASAVEYVAMLGFYAGNLVAAGSTIKVYGIGEPT